jgi:hypothetical protein
METAKESLQALRPADVCKALLAALEASEGRRRKRKRDQTPDAIGLSIKRSLLARVVEDDPSPEAFEEWLLNYCLASSAGSIAAMARTIFEEWCLTHSIDEFKAWLGRGAPSDDANTNASPATKNEGSRA